MNDTDPRNQEPQPQAGEAPEQAPSATPNAPSGPVSGRDASTDLHTAPTDPSPPPGRASAATEAAAPADTTAPSREPADAQSAPAATVEAGASEAPDAGADTAGGGAAEDGAPTKKKRRRKKKKAKTPGAESADKSHAPFAHFFEGAAGRRHAFGVGEIVAGRVQRVGDGAIVVDLFGKAIAVADEREPREIEPLPEPTAKSEHASEQETPAETAPPAAESAHAGGETVRAPSGPGSHGVTVPAPSPADRTVPAPPAAPATMRSSTVDTIPGFPAVNPDLAADGAAEAAGRERLASDGAPSPAAVLTEEERALGELETVSGTVAAPSEHPVEDTAPAAAVGAPPAASDEAPARDATSAEAPAAAPESAADDAPEPEPPPPPALGSIFRGRVGGVAESGHIVLVNRAIDRDAARAKILATRDAKDRVLGLVYGFNRGGFDVLVEGIRAFCPASAISLHPVDDPAEFVGRRLEFTVPENKSGGRGIILSRRSVLEREARKLARERMKTLTAGERLAGRVTHVREFGALVDIGDGVEGLVHQSELSWTRGVRPADVVKPGDEVEVEVLAVHPPSRKDRYGKLSLSLRACLPDPWDQAGGEVLSPGSVRKGRVVRTAEFGAFVEIAPGVDGLVHISELGGRDVTHANQVVNEGDELDVVVERVDRKQRRISLSKLTAEDLAAIESGELDPKKAHISLRPGTHVTVIIKRVEHHGMQVQVDGVLGKRGRGYISNRDLPESGERGKQLTAGSKVDVKIAGTDRDGRLRCTIKGLLLDEERKAVKEYRREAAKQGLGTFGDLLRAKLGQQGDDQ